MAMNIFIGLSTMVTCLTLQSALLVYARHYYENHVGWIKGDSVIGSFMVINIIMLLLVLGNMGQIAIWALVYVWLGEFSEFATAFYHSGVNFTSLGYGDIVMSESRRLLGPLQSVNGVLMIGISTAGLMTAFQDVVQRSTR